MRSGPLAGLSVLELGGLGPSAFATMVLADLGADVVRVDRAQPVAGGVPTMDPRVDILNRGKRSLSLDLKRPEAVEIFLTLAAHADVVTEGFRPGVAERLGVGPDACLDRNAALVYARMTGWGQDGPLAAIAGHDINYIALSGALHAIGPAGGPPQVPVNLVGDFGGGATYLVIGILAALREAGQSGRGQVIDGAIIDGAAQLMASVHSLLAGGLWHDERGANLLDGGAPFYAVYETSDGRHVAVGAAENKFYAKLLHRLGLPDDPRHQMDRARWSDVRERIQAVFLTRTRDEWAAVFDGTDCCVTPVLGIEEAADHPHLRHRGSVISRDGIVQPGVAPRFSRTVTESGGAPPVPGRDSLDVLASWGIPAGEELVRAGIVVQAAPGG